MTKQQQIKQLEQALANTREALQRLDEKFEFTPAEQTRYDQLEQQYEELYLQLSGVKGEYHV